MHISLLVDVFERRSGVPDELSSLGAGVSVVALEAGDYDVGGGTVIERKTVDDLAASVASGRVWHQIRRLRHASSFPMLVVEGDARQYPHGPAAFRGALLTVIDQGVAVLRTASATESAEWLFDLARRRKQRQTKHRPPYVRRPRKSDATIPEAVLAAIPGLSTSCARALLDRFGSVRAVAAASPEDWRNVTGIGPVRTRALRHALHEPVSNSSPPKAKRSAT